MDEHLDAILMGAGWIAREAYLPAFARLGWKVCCFDTDPVSGTLAEALDACRRNPQALCVVATPNATHLDLSQRCLSAGCRVLVEKPACLPAEAAGGAADGLPLSRMFTSTPFRFRPDVARLLQAVADGAIGALREVSVSWRRLSGIPRPGSWYTARAWSGGGVLVDLGPHLLDVAMTLLGWGETTVMAAEVVAMMDGGGGASSWMPAAGGDNLCSDVEVGARLELSDPRGRVLRLWASWHSDVDRDATVIELRGTHGWLRLDTLFGFAPGPQVAQLSGAVAAEIPLERVPAIDFARMLTLVRDGRAATGVQGLAVMKIVATAYELAGFPPAGTAATEVPR